VPLLGLTAAFVFAAQMVNFPVAGGTSGHLLGAVLAATLLGPSGAVLVLTAVLVVQCFMFADGGVLALGANVLNMGVMGGGGGYLVYQGLGRVLRGARGRLGAAAFAAWGATVAGALMVAAELALSGVVPWTVGWPAMAGIHALIGVGEALITALVLVALLRTRPELVLEPDSPGAAGLREVLTYGLLIALGVALFLSPFASRWPDGLERVAQALGIAGRAAEPLGAAPWPDYALRGVSAGWGTAVAGVIGTLVVLALALALGRVIAPRAVPGGPAGDRR
jgi:cobalt/nickel transport system permease protein